MNRKQTFAVGISLLAMGCASLYACGGDESSELGDDPAENTSSGTTSGTGGNGTGGDSNPTLSTGGTTGQGGNTGGNCGELVIEPIREALPADIIFVIDNSGSMGDEIAAVETNINVNFAAIIQASGVDYQVIMVTDHGTDSYNVCIGPPLSGTTACGGPPVEVPNQFYHYDINVQSTDSLCIALDTLHGPNGGGVEVDENGNHQNGWNPLLRPNAVKIFVEITDDGIYCNYDGTQYTGGSDSMQGQTDAVNWDQKLLSLSPGQFGTQSNRNYQFYSIIGLPANQNNIPYTEFDPIVTGSCSGAYSPGMTYQWLSKGTGALRFPVCSFQSYDAVFNDIAAGVVDVTAVPCEFDLPDPPQGQQYDYNTLDVIYTPGGMGAPQTFVKVDSAGLCMPGAFYIESGNHVVLCPQACQVVEADDDAKLDINLQCGYIPA